MKTQDVIAESSGVMKDSQEASSTDVAGVVTVVGTGLIGGSFALILKDKGLATKIIGVDNNESHRKRALELNIVDEVSPLTEAIAKSKLIVLAIPVDALDKLLPAVLDQVEDQVVMDMGSTKENVIALVANHPKRSRFVASHPMWGTEYSGPEAAVRTAFSNKAAVICDAKNSDQDALDLVVNL